MYRYTEGITIVLLSLRTFHCWVFCIGSCKPVHEDRTLNSVHTALGLLSSRIILLKCHPFVALTRPSAPSGFDEGQAFFWTWITARLPNQSICSFGVGMNKRNEWSESGNELRERMNLTTSFIIWIHFQDFVVYESLTLLCLFIQVFCVYNFYIHFRP